MTVPKEVIEYFQKKISEQKAMEGMGIYVNYVNPIIFKGAKVWALGSKVYYNRRPDETFHEFIIDILKLTLGKDWWNDQAIIGDKHFIMKCFLRFYEWQKKNSIETNRVNERMFGAKPDGLTKTLLALAFDVCSLQHTNNLPEYLLKRLKNKNEYQGARYEIAIAAIFARLGCNIKFLDEKEKLKIKHCEFIATHQKTGISIAVEAKSRQRQGVIHAAGNLDEKKLLKGDVQQLLNRALKQNPKDRSFMAFIDLNSPLTPELNFKDKKWVKDILKFMGSYKSTLANPAPCNALFFTNYSFHYQTDKEADLGEFLSFIPTYSKFPLPNLDFLKMITAALNHYGRVPNIDLDKEDILS